MATLQSVNTMVNACTEMFQSVVGDLYAQFLVTRASPSELTWDALDSKFKDALDPFAGLKTSYQQTEHVKRLHAFIPPVEYPISKIVNRSQLFVTDRKAQFTKPHLHTVTGQYVSIRSMIVALNSHTDLIKMCLSRVHVAGSDVQNSFFDGLHWHGHPLFGQKVIAIRLYGDDFEPANPLGSHRCIYKVGCIYYQFENLPLELQSKIDNIFWHFAITLTM